MNDQTARQRRYVRLLLEGFSPDEVREMMKPKKSGCPRKKLPLEKPAGDDAESRGANVIFTCPNANQVRSAG
jgi:hypothetical protein